MDQPDRRGAQLEERTLCFAADVVRFVEAFPSTKAGKVIGHQVLRSGTSIGANYREANRAESSSDFAHKIALCVKEAAESHYWLLLCARVGLGSEAARRRLAGESNELLAIFTTILRRARGLP